MQIGQTPPVVAVVLPDLRQMVNAGGGQTPPQIYAAVAATAAPVPGLTSYGAVATGKADSGAPTDPNGGRGDSAGAGAAHRTGGATPAKSASRSGRSRGQALDILI